MAWGRGAGYIGKIISEGVDCRPTRRGGNRCVNKPWLIGASERASERGSGRVSAGGGKRERSGRE